MTRLLQATCLALALQAAVAAPALASSSFGASFGFSQADSGNLARFDTLHGSSAFRYRWGALTPFTDFGLGLVSRSQTLSPDRTYVFETAGGSVDASLRLGPVRLGSALELAWLRQIVADTAQAGTLRFHNGAGFLLEPYLGFQFTPDPRKDLTLELSVHYPVPLPQMRVDPAIGPRVMLTMWVSDDEESEDAPDTKAPATESDDSTASPKPAQTAPRTPAPGKTPPVKSRPGR
ncbi:MAG: hypothetical protein VKP62_06970 [Candidatus Sericytochromatia bacterium]|nr:hypothetical protein [Candidatus Sericytochromatia bacterium]